MPLLLEDLYVGTVYCIQCSTEPLRHWQRRRRRRVVAALGAVGSFPLPLLPVHGGAFNLPRLPATSGSKLTKIPPLHRPSFR